MRDLVFGDVFKMSAVVRKMGIRKELSSLKDTMKNGTNEEVGFQILGILLENMDKAEKEIIQFIADVGEMKPEEAKAMKIGEMKQFFTDLANQGDFKDFFRLASEKAKE